MGGSSGGGGGSTVSTTVPWSKVKPYLTEGYSQLQDYASQVPEYFPGQTYANFDPLQEQAMQGQLNYADALKPSINNQFGAMNYGLNSVYDPQSNPVINDYIAAASRPLTEAYQDTVGNAIAGNAVGAGGLGGSRQGIAEGMASKNYMNAMGDLSANVYNNAYNQGLDQQARMLTLAPQTMQSGMLPNDIYGQVGSAYQGMDQAAINEAMARHNFDQSAGFDRYSQYLNTLNANPYISSYGTAPNPNASSALAGGLGGALGGAGLATSLWGPSAFAAGSFAAPFAWPLAIGGGLLGAFG